MHPKMGWLGVIACIIPAMILPYYCVIGGWVLKFLSVYVTGKGAAALRTDISMRLLWGDRADYMVSDLSDLTVVVV